MRGRRLGCTSGCEDAGLQRGCLAQYTFYPFSETGEATSPTETPKSPPLFALGGAYEWCPGSNTVVAGPEKADN